MDMAIVLPCKRAADCASNASRSSIYTIVLCVYIFVYDKVVKMITP